MSLSLMRIITPDIIHELEHTPGIEYPLYDSGLTELDTFLISDAHK